MPALDYNFVKAEIEKTGDKLLSKVYLNNKAHLDIECGRCEEEYQQTYKEFKRGRRHGRCPKAVRVKKASDAEQRFLPPLSYDLVKKEIEKTGDKLISKVYVNNKSHLDIECCICNEQYKQTYAGIQMGRRHLNCPELIRIKRDETVRTKTRICKQCNASFIEKKDGQILCSQECRHNYNRAKKGTGFFERIGRMGGLIGGKVSASRQTRRSINEIYFYNLCCWMFDEVLNNVPMFDGWDCDVILPNEKIAIAWNGIYHYKKVSKKHNLEQVQSRDRIKEKIITNHGYQYYVIKDMGSKSKKFVEAEFEKFMSYCSIILDPVNFEAMKNSDDWNNAKEIQKS